MNIKRIGIDLAKQVFQVHGVDGQEKAVLRQKLARAKMLTYFQKLPPCLIGMEACSSAHYWARELQKIGHTVKLMAPQFVKPYVKSNKNDANDAEAICEAVARPTMLLFYGFRSCEMSRMCGGLLARIHPTMLIFYFMRLRGCDAKLST